MSQTPGAQCVCSESTSANVIWGGAFSFLCSLKANATEDRGHLAILPHLYFKEEANLISLTGVLLFCNCSPVSFSQSPMALRGGVRAQER